MLKKNAGVEERNKSDLLQSEVAQTKSSFAVLQKKEKLYDQLGR